MWSIMVTPGVVCYSGSDCGLLQWLWLWSLTVTLVVVCYSDWVWSVTEAWVGFDTEALGGFC